MMGFDYVRGVDARTTRSIGINTKADVLVTVNGDIVKGISVKKFTASFNQIDKRWVDRYADIWNMPYDVVTIIRKYCGVKGYRPTDLGVVDVKDTRRFFLTELSDVEQLTILNFFNGARCQITNTVLRGDKQPYADYVLVTKPDIKDSAVADIENVIAYYSGPAHITRRGNLKLGKITIQRKGGNGGGSTAQMLQFKFSPKDIFDI